MKQVNLKYVYLALFFLIMVNLTALGTFSYYRFFQVSESEMHEDEQLKVENFSDTLGLTDSQLEKILEIRGSFNEIADSISSDLKRNRVELFQILNQAKVDNDQLEMLLEKITIFQTELQRQVIKYMLKEKEILTPQQREKYFALIQEWLIREAGDPQEGGLGIVEGFEREQERHESSESREKKKRQ